jgi:hypothetical protein
MFAVIEKDGLYYLGEYQDKFQITRENWGEGPQALQDAKVYDIALDQREGQDVTIVSDPPLPRLDSWSRCNLRAIKKELISV